jgi:tetratricopeptide (TPR) repeat protein
MRRTIREKEPERPSTKLSTLMEGELTTTAKRRHTEAPKLVHLVRGDLDWIVMKCLEKDRARRYETANGLAREIQRHLSCEPVAARPPSRLYEFQKSVRRHKFGFAAAGAVGAALLIGLAASSWLLVKEKAALAQAQTSQKKSQTEAAKATAISDLLQEMLRSANPDALKGSDYTVRQMLDDLSAGRANQLQDPEVEAPVRTIIGKAYYRLGVADKAKGHLERALDLRRRIFGSQSEQVAESLVDIAWVYFELSQHAKGEPFAREALEIYLKRGTPARPVIAALWVSQKLAAGQNRAEEVEAIMAEALNLAAKSPGTDFPELASMLHALAELRNQQTRYAEAEELAQKAVAMHRRLRREGDLETGWALLALGNALLNEKQLDEAERSLRDALGIFRKQYAAGHKSVDAAFGELKLVLEAKGDLAAISSLYQNMLADQRIAFGNESPAVAETLGNLAASLFAQGKPAEADQALREAMDIALKLRGSDLENVPQAVRRLAESLKSQGKPQEAEKIFEEVILRAQQKLGETNLILGELLHDYGEFLSDENKLQAAVEYRLKSLRIRRTHPDDNLAWTLRNLGSELIALDRPGEAEGYLKDSLAVYRKLHPQEEIHGTAWPSMRLGEALEQQGKLPEAEQAYHDAMTGFAKCQALGGGDYWRAVQLLVGLLKEENNLAEGSALCRAILGQQRVAFTNGNIALARTLSRLLGEVCNDLGNADEAVRTQREAIEAYGRQKAAAPTNLLYSAQEAGATWMLAGMLDGAGRLDEAEVEYRLAIFLHEKASVDFPTEKVITDRLDAVKEQLAELVRWRRRAREAKSIYLEEAQHADAAELLNQCAWFLAYCVDPNARDGASAVAFAEKAVAATSRTNANFLDTLSAAYAETGQFDKAIIIEREAIAVSRSEKEKRYLASVLTSYANKILHRDHPGFDWLANALVQGGRLSEAEEFFREELIQFRKLAPKSPSAETSEFGYVLHHLAEERRQQRALANARPPAEEAVALYRRHPDWPSHERDHGFRVLEAVLMDLGDFTGLEPLLGEDLETLRKRLPPGDPLLAAVIAQLTSTLLALKEFIRAEPFARECLAIREKKLPDDWSTFNARSLLGGALLGQKKYSNETETMLLTGYEGMKEREKANPPPSRLRLKEALQRLAQFYDETKRPERAGELKEKLAELDRAAN